MIHATLLRYDTITEKNNIGLQRDGLSMNKEGILDKKRRINPFFFGVFGS